MKTSIKNLFLLPALIAGLGLILAGRVTAQTFTTLYSFTALNNNTNSDGANPNGLILSGNTLYGTAFGGGSFANGLGNAGTVFAINTDGTGFTNLHTFTATPGPNYTNSDGANPYAGLVLSGNTLYGTARNGGSSGVGTVFKVNTDGTGFTTLYSFTNGSDGANPYAGLILSGNTLYGTAYYGGSSGQGTVFAVNTDGSGFTLLHSFTALSGINYYKTNSDGANPYAGLVLSGNTLYGTAYQGGSAGFGTVFAVNTDGSGFTVLHSFTAIDNNGHNSDGAYPRASLILSGNTLYGTAYNGGLGYGLGGGGTVFKVNTDGTSFTNLHSFTGGYFTDYNDGRSPQAGLVLSCNTLYGTASEGGSWGISGNGTVFKVNTDGTGFTNLHSFTAGYPRDGANPYAGLIVSGNTLYGTAKYGGSSGNGTVFSLFIPPQLTIILSETNVVLMWPSDAACFTLQSTTNLVPPAVWTAVSPAPVFINGQYTVTNPISGTQQYYRLSQ